MWKQLQKYEAMLPLIEDIAALGIGIDELIALKAGVNQATKLYNMSPLAATLRLIEDIKKFVKLGGLDRELQRLLLQKYALIQACSNQSQALIALGKLQNQRL